MAEIRDGLGDEHEKCQQKYLEEVVEQNYDSDYRKPKSDFDHVVDFKGFVTTRFRKRACDFSKKRFQDDCLTKKTDYILLAQAAFRAKNWVLYETMASEFITHPMW